LDATKEVAQEAMLQLTLRTDMVRLEASADGNLPLRAHKHIINADLLSRPPEPIPAISPVFRMEQAVLLELICDFDKKRVCNPDRLRNDCRCTHTLVVYVQVLQNSDGIVCRTLDSHDTHSFISEMFMI